MKLLLRLAFLGITLLALTKLASSNLDKTASRRLSSSHRRMISSRQSSFNAESASPIRLAPPVRITNAHTGRAPETPKKTSRMSAIAPLNQIPTSTVTRRKRIMRRRLPANFKRNPNAARKRTFKRKSQPAVARKEKVNYRMARKIVDGVLRNVKGGARLVGASGRYVNTLTLPANASLIRPNITDNFSCKNRRYGYYADQDNDCQLFHVCVVLKQIFPDIFTDEDTIKFSFICPNLTVFTQDAMVCAWPRDAVPCKDSHLLYHMNQNFFVVSSDVPKQPQSGGYGSVIPSSDGSKKPQSGSKTPGPLPNSSVIQKEKAPLPNSSPLI